MKISFNEYEDNNWRDTLNGVLAKWEADLEEVAAQIDYPVDEDGEIINEAKLKEWFTLMAQSQCIKARQVMREGAGDVMGEHLHAKLYRLIMSETDDIIDEGYNAPQERE